jgi:hypothetical protein
MDRWRLPGLSIGYEHTFIHAAAERHRRAGARYAAIKREIQELSALGDELGAKKTGRIASFQRLDAMAMTLQSYQRVRDRVET